jgi:hypothetical protein
MCIPAVPLFVILFALHYTAARINYTLAITISAAQDSLINRFTIQPPEVCKTRLNNSNSKSLSSKTN